MIRLLSAASLLVLAPVAVSAQDAAPDAMAARTQQAREAQETAKLMAAVLQANAVAQRQYTGMVPGALAGGYRGAVSLPDEDDAGLWFTTIVGQPGGENAPLVALAEYEIRDGQILSEVIHAAGQMPVLDGDRVAMARAQIVAPRAVIAAADASFCVDGEDVAASAPASVTTLTFALPPREDGAFEAYVLNGPFEGSAIPLGKHYRVAFDEFGVIGDPELLSNTCEVIAWDESDAELSSKVYVTEMEGIDAPNEIHTFISSQLPMNIGVVTGEIIWPMAGGMIAPPVPAADAGY